MKKVSLAFGVLASAAAVIAVFAGTGTAGSAATPPKNLSAQCKNPQLAVMAPITGPAATIGREQRNWAKYAVDNFNAADENEGQRARLIEFDTQLDPARASTAAQRIASNANILGVVGPAGSQEVKAVAPAFKKAGITYVSGSATATDLTKAPRSGGPTFFRVVPNDAVQGPTIARYIRTVLKPTEVWVIDDQTSYGQPLAASVAANLRANKVKVTRESVGRDDTDFSSIVTRIPSGGRVIVVMAHQIAANAQIFGTQLKEQGKTATIFGTDGLFSSDFKVNGSYVSSFAPDIRNITSSRRFVTGYFKKFGKNAPLGTFGPPSYVAAQALLNAISQSCTTGRADGNVNRAEVLKYTKQTLIRSSILGFNISFDARGDVRGAKFFIFRVEGGKFVLVPNQG
jgi:branched-chain amino acid transport system substrate-binding protein